MGGAGPSITSCSYNIPARNGSTLSAAVVMTCEPSRRITSAWGTCAFNLFAASVASMVASLMPAMKRTGMESPASCTSESIGSAPMMGLKCSNTSIMNCRTSAGKTLSPRMVSFVALALDRSMGIFCVCSINACLGGTRPAAARRMSACTRSG